MRFEINGRSIRIDDEDEIGAGGEARVFEWKDKAVKIFHAPEDAFQDKEEEERRRRLKRKQQKIADFPSDLPRGVVAPQAPVREPSGRFRGYVMDRVDGHDLRFLARRSWREKYRFSNEDVQAVFQKFYRIFEGLHEKDVIAGDFNDTNGCFQRGSHRSLIIDTDSFQFSGYPCTVAHNQYLDPRLYEKKLAQSAVFDEDSDWYSFLTLLLESLLFVHPYGGTHSDYPTLLRRAEAQHSIFQDDVRYPSSGTDWSVLPPGAVQFFRNVFDEGTRKKPPEDLLRVDWSTCSSCGVEHGHGACPLCTSQETPIPQTTTVSGALELETEVDTDGTIVHAEGSRCVYWKDGMYRREDGSTILQGELTPEFRFRFVGQSTWVGSGDKVVKIKDGEVQKQVKCDQFQGELCFDTTSRYLHHLEDGWLFDEDTGRVGKRVRNRTVFWTGNRFGMGLSQIGKATEWFSFYPGHSGLTDIDLPAIQGKLLEARVVFDGTNALLSLVEEYRGARRGLLALLDDGNVVGTLQGKCTAHQLLGETRSLTLRNQTGLVLTERGLVAFKTDFGDSFREAKIFEKATDLITPGCRLFTTDTPDALLVAGAQKIHRLTMQ